MSKMTSSLTLRHLSQDAGTSGGLVGHLSIYGLSMVSYGLPHSTMVARSCFNVLVVFQEEESKAIRSPKAKVGLACHFTSFYWSKAA